MKIDSLMEALPDIYSQVDREKILRAYRYAEAAHAEQKRASGEPYVSHCIAVAAILAELRVPTAVVIAGLLHDTVEDTDITLEDIAQEFTEEVAKLVDGVTKLANLPRVSQADLQVALPQADGQVAAPVKHVEELNVGSAIGKGTHHRRDVTSETLRKTFMAMGDDVRVVLIKLADRLHNMRTLGYMPEAKRRRIALQTMEIFAPLANRLGIWQIKWELEDLAFRYIEPARYKEIAEQLAERREDRERQVTTIIQRVKTVLENAGVKSEISGRPKHIYSIYKKMQEKGRTFESLRDIRAMRLIVPDIAACYTALGIIHMHWRPVPGEFDDYIAAPKDNFYQSLHTAVYYDDGKPLEVQIRTHEMHQDAEYGIAAHWRYKERGGRRDDVYEKRINSLRKMMDWRSDVDDASEFVDSIKSDVLQDRVYAFTPRGDIIDLPQGSTPIDFAYHVHTDVGHRCRGAKANGKLVPLDYELKTGDHIEILTSKQGGPSTDWLNTNLGLVKTQRARAKIRQWFKQQDRGLNLTQGKQVLDREIRRLGLPDVDLMALANEFEYRTLDDLYVGVGCGDVSVGRIINKLSEAEKARQEQVLAVRPPSEIKDGAAISVLGLRNVLTTFARCCNPAPGDEIVGYITRGRGATIHRQDCPNILRLSEHERVVKVSWGEPRRTFPVSIQVKAYDRQGLMGDISTVLSNENVNLVDINLKMAHNLANINLVLEVDDINQLARVLTRIENLQNVMEALRTKPG